jgi:hypothetical protein
LVKAADAVLQHSKLKENVMNKTTNHRQSGPAALPAWIADTGSKQPPSNAPSVPTAQAELETRAQAPASAGLRAPASKTPQKAFISTDQENRARSTPTAASKPAFFGKVRNFFQSVGRFFSNLFSNLFRRSRKV